MRNLTLIHLIYAGLAFIGLALSFAVSQALRSRRRRTQASPAAVPAEYLLREIEALHGALAEAQKKAEDQDRRVRRLEHQLQTAAARAYAEQDEELVVEAQPRERGVTERRYQVLKLARQGLTIEEISTRLSLPHGEVGLILGLRSLQAGKPRFGIQV